MSWPALIPGHSPAGRGGEEEEEEEEEGGKGVGGMGEQREKGGGRDGEKRMQRGTSTCTRRLRMTQ